MDRLFVIGMLIFAIAKLLSHIPGAAQNPFEFFCGLGTGVLLCGVARMVIKKRRGVAAND